MGLEAGAGNSPGRSMLQRVATSPAPLAYAFQGPGCPRRVPLPLLLSPTPGSFD